MKPPNTSSAPRATSTHTLAAEPQPVMIGRYLLHRQIARGGMATIHIARLMGDEGFTRIVAAKRLLPEFAEDAEFVAMFLDEARIASKVHHRNVVPVLDVVTTGEEAILVQEYVHGAPLHALLRAARQTNTRIPLEIAVSIACQVLAGLHAAHETLDELGSPLNIVHRDVSPQNVMIAVDGTARLLDFGVAKATMAAHVTREGQFKGKLAYSAPEQLRGNATRQSDLYSLAVLLWELAVGHRMHNGAQAEVELVANIMTGRLPTITSALAAEREAMGPDRWRELLALEPILKTGLAVDVTERWLTAADFEQALADVVRPATLAEVAAWLRSQGKELIDKHDRVLAAEEASWRRVGTTVQRRIAAAAGEQRRGTQVSFGGAARNAISQPRPLVPGKRFGMHALIAVLAALVIVLGIGIVLAVRGPTRTVASPAPVTPAELPPAALPPRPAPVTPPLPSAVPTPPPPPVGVAKTVEPQNKADTSVAAETKSEIKTDGNRSEIGDGKADGNDGPPSAQTNPAPRGPAPTRVARPPVRPSPPPVKKSPAPPSVSSPSSTATGPAELPVPTPPPAAPANKDCNPPYYYEGEKKVFKANCL